MLKTVIIADDNTGANASAILLNKLKFSTLSLINYDPEADLTHYDAVAVSTDSRGVSQQDAYDRVKKTLGNFEGVSPVLFNKRIDSTLRGNLGSEINAFLDCFPSKKVIVVPAYPDSGRICRDGVVYVNDRLLEETDVARDPKMPITSSVAKELIQKQTTRSIGNIMIDDVRGNNELRNVILNKATEHDIIILDAVTNEDIKQIATALTTIDLDIISVDPGPFTYYLTEALVCKLQRKKYIYLVGSVVDTTYEQLKYITTNEDFKIIYIDPMLLISDDYLDIDRIINDIESSIQQCVCITTTNPLERNVLDLNSIALSKCCMKEDISKMINNKLSDILIALIEQSNNINGVFCSGGDTALGFLENTNARGIELKNEVIPLSVYGKIVGGKFEGLPIITKGGMIGDSDAYVTIKNFFEEANKNEE